MDNLAVLVLTEILVLKICVTSMMVTVLSQMSHVRNQQINANYRIVNPVGILQEFALQLIRIVREMMFV
jgi:hypothetical protein